MLESPANGRRVCCFGPAWGWGLTDGPEEQWLNRAGKGGWGVSALTGREGRPSQRAQHARTTWLMLDREGSGGAPWGVAPPSWPLPVLEALVLGCPGVTCELRVVCADRRSLAQSPPRAVFRGHFAGTCRITVLSHPRQSLQVLGVWKGAV